MLRTLVIVLAAGVLAAAAVATTGCARRPAAGDSSARQATAREGSARVLQTAIYAPVLSRYLGTPAENSFPGHVFKTVYVLDHAFPNAGNPVSKHEQGTLIAPSTQRQITAALAGIGHVAFIADQRTVVETADGCMHVKDGGILITLGTLNGDSHRVKVAVGGFVTCLGATWLTYVVQNQPGSGWRVTGTTGPIAIS